MDGAIGGQPPGSTSCALFGAICQLHDLDTLSLGVPEDTPLLPHDAACVRCIRLQHPQLWLCAFQGGHRSLLTDVCCSKHLKTPAHPRSAGS